MINELSKEIHSNNKAKGFYEDKKNVGEMLCLIHSEVSEALEADRNQKYCDLHNENWTIDGRTLKEDLNIEDDDQFIVIFKMSCKDTFEDELADIMIRVMDLAAFKGVDLEQHIKAKMRYNSLRPYKHGKKY
ncbi:nucleotide pyrophosphohydrolase [Neptunitalea chrysea]|uniref:Nucleotide pyrophosphohydrolase n=1 Tax=Neptunitalea chrysea TaxID=1647581 RepID=A0A9W6B3F4_9FLAO|nr:hypothetical protein [Neptunitalea chrysea]GLB51729.1 nucleotide pyrophosphohydrolase [Neptunitalea chrysea]